MNESEPPNNVYFFNKRWMRPEIAISEFQSSAVQLRAEEVAVAETGALKPAPAQGCRPGALGSH